MNTQNLQKRPRATECRRDGERSDSPMRKRTKRIDSAPSQVLQYFDLAADVDDDVSGDEDENDSLSGGQWQRSRA